MLSDLQDRKDIELLINAFYDKVKVDDQIGHIFMSIIGHDWSHHLPVMYTFWDTILFGKAGYSGNPIKKHIEVDRQVPFRKEHFDRWLALWNETVDDMFDGPVAADAKNRAMLMAHLINMKVEMAHNNNFIA